MVGTGNIDDITVDPNATGDFSLLIGDPNDPNNPNAPGANDWVAGDLRYAGGTSTITGIRLAGHLAGKFQAGGDIYCERIVGDIVVAEALSINGSGNDALYADEIIGDIVLTRGMWGDLYAGTLDGDDASRSARRE